MSVFLVLSVSALTVCAGDAAAAWPSLHRVETRVNMIIECMCVALDKYLNQWEADCLRIDKVCWCVYFGLSSNTVTIFFVYFAEYSTYLRLSICHLCLHGYFYRQPLSCSFLLISLLWLCVTIEKLTLWALCWEKNLLLGRELNPWRAHYYYGAYCF